MKHIKMLGLLAVVAMAFTALVGVSSASAATSFTASALGSSLEETTLTKHVFTITGSETAVCEEVHFAGVTEGVASGGLGFTSQTQTVRPEYKKCTSGFTATVTNTNCHYLLNANGGVTVTKANAAGAECSLLIKVSNALATCETTVGAQSIPGAVTYSNAAGDDINVKVNASKIDGKVIKSTGLCPLVVGTHSDAATYTGESVIAAGATKLAVE